MKRFKLSNLFSWFSKKKQEDDNNLCEYTEYFLVEAPVDEFDESESDDVIFYRYKKD